MHLVLMKYLYNCEHNISALTFFLQRSHIIIVSWTHISLVQVGWLRASDKMIISVHTKAVIQNDRIAVKYEPIENAQSKTIRSLYENNQDAEDSSNGTWRLIIRQLKETDKGCYMCQINTSPMISQLGCLDILGNIT